MNPDLIGWSQTNNFKEHVLSGRVYRQYYSIEWGITSIYMKWRRYEWTEFKKYIPKDVNISQVWDDK
ncbi:MAG: hypothetical protein DRP08_03465 [Candidatus Aenigmatarchaeota archaeon]|nr:MAG: hypothetical protein DRP08_03465 [Candidatus Aenigmarchaeota archaeon]